MAHPELGSKILDEVIEQISSVGKVETQARLEGRSMTMVLVPDKKPVKKEKPVVAESPATEADVLPTETPVETPVIETTAPATDTPENSEE
jgi:translation initiation factor IF-3